MAVFERYTEESRRAIFFTQQTAFHGGATTINSGHLFLGLLSEARTRANRIFQLREAFPNETAQQSSLAKRKPIKGGLPLTDDLKRIIACAALEADSLQDRWIDTDHLVLGILREGENSGATRLNTAGLNLEKARQLVIANQGSRSRHRVPLWQRVVLPSPVGAALQIAFLLGLILAMVLLWR